MRLSYSRWFDYGLVLMIGTLLGLMAWPFLWGDASTSQQFWLGVWGNVVATILVLIIFWLLNYAEVRFSQIRKFFGIRSGRPFFIFVGHLAHDNLSSGVADVVELNEAHELRANFQNFVPGLGDLYLLRRLRLVDVEIRVIVADKARRYGEYRSCSFVTIGSGGSNGVSEMIESEIHTRVDFAGQKIRIGNNREEKSTGRGVIVCRRDNSGHVWFYVAGQGGPDTAGSARFLRANWNLMSQKYPRTDFYYLLDTRQSASGLQPTVVEDMALR